MTALIVQQAATWLSRSSAMSRTPTDHFSQPGLLPPTQRGFAEPLLWWSPSTNSARIFWAAATVTQQGFAESDSLYNMYSTGEQDNYVQHKDSGDDSLVWLTNTQLRNSAEEDSWVWLLTNSSGTQQKKMAESGSPHTHGSETQQKKMAESGSPHRTLPGPQIQYRTGLSLASQWDKYREGKTAHLLSY